MHSAHVTAEVGPVNYLRTNGPREVARRRRQITEGQLAFWHKTPKGKPKIVIRREGKMFTLIKDAS